MKRRKPPVVLGTLLVLLLGAVAIGYRPGSKSPDDHAPEAPRESNETQSRPKMDTKDVTSIMSNSMKAPAQPEASRGPGAMAAPPMPGTNKPSISMRQQIQTKPTRPEGGTSSQWYTDQTPKDGK
jgi:hypothetical protein